MCATSPPAAEPRTLLVSTPCQGECGQTLEESRREVGGHLHSPGGADAVPAGLRRLGIGSVRDLPDAERTETGKRVPAGTSESF